MLSLILFYSKCLVIVSAFTNSLTALKKGITEALFELSKPRNAQPIPIHNGNGGRKHSAHENKICKFDDTDKSQYPGS